MKKCGSILYVLRRVMSEKVVAKIYQLAAY